MRKARVHAATRIRAWAWVFQEVVRTEKANRRFPFRAYAAGRIFGRNETKEMVEQWRTRRKEKW